MAAIDTEINNSLKFLEIVKMGNNINFWIIVVGESSKTSTALAQFGKDEMSPVPLVMMKDGCDLSGLVSAHD